MDLRGIIGFHGLVDGDHARCRPRNRNDAFGTEALGAKLFEEAAELGLEPPDGTGELAFRRRIAFQETLGNAAAADIERVLGNGFAAPDACNELGRTPPTSATRIFSPAKSEDAPANESEASFSPGMTER